MRVIWIFLLFTVNAWACLEPPLPTTPGGPTWSEIFESRTSSGSLRWSAEVTAWRHQCPGDDPLLLMTFEPLVDAPFVCSPSFDVIQNSVQHSNFRLLTDPSNLSSSFCSDLLVKSTFAVGQRSFDTQWDDMQAFSLAWNSTVFLDVGAFNPADFNGDPGGPVALHGSMSGSWFDPVRNGEGFVLDFGEIESGPIATIFWFTHRDGVPYWLIATTSYAPGQTEIVFDLLEVSGTGFGEDFNPDDLEISDFGVISLEFDSCHTGTAVWETQDDQSGLFNLQRITAGLHGVSCL